MRDASCRHLAARAEHSRDLLPAIDPAFTPQEDAMGRYYEITGLGTVTPVLDGVVDTKAWCPRRDSPPFAAPC